MKKFFSIFILLAVALCLTAFTGCSTITEITGVGDGKVTILEATAVEVGVDKVISAVPSIAAKKALHLISGALVDKIDTTDYITLALLDAYLKDLMAASPDVDQSLITDEVRDIVSSVKNAIIAGLGIDTDDSRYMVGIKLILEAIYRKTA